MWRAADGTKDYVDMMAYDLSRLAVTGLMNKTAISPSEIDYLLWGTVSQEIRTSNIARDVALEVPHPHLRLSELGLVFQQQRMRYSLLLLRVTALLADTLEGGDEHASVLSLPPYDARDHVSLQSSIGADLEFR